MTDDFTSQTLAYLLDELDAEGRRTFEQRLERDPVVAAVFKSCADSLADFALDEAPPKRPTAQERQAALDGILAATLGQRRRTVRLGWAHVWAAAAAILLMLNLWLWTLHERDRAVRAGTAAGETATAIAGPAAVHGFREASEESLLLRPGLAPAHPAAGGREKTAKIDAARIAALRMEYARLTAARDSLNAQYQKLLQDIAATAVADVGTDKFIAMELVDAQSYANGVHGSALDFSNPVLTGSGVAPAGPPEPSGGAPAPQSSVVAPEPSTPASTSGGPTPSGSTLTSAASSGTSASSAGAVPGSGSPSGNYASNSTNPPSGSAGTTGDSGQSDSTVLSAVPPAASYTPPSGASENTGNADSTSSPTSQNSSPGDQTPSDQTPSGTGQSETGASDQNSGGAGQNPAPSGAEPPAASQGTGTDAQTASDLPDAWSLFDQANHEGFLDLYNLPQVSDDQTMELWVQPAGSSGWVAVGPIPEQYYGASGSVYYRLPSDSMTPSQVLITVEPKATIPSVPTGPTVLRGP